MRYLFYIILLYVFLPLNHRVDFTTILMFYIIYNEDERFALIFSFLGGFLIDLYYPVHLGVHMLFYTLLAQLLIYLKKYIIRNLLTTALTFIIVYVTKTFVLYLLISSPIVLEPMLFTILIFCPFWVLVHKLMFGVWMKI
jgi:rod shape-determining protein MreD